MTSPKFFAIAMAVLLAVGAGAAVLAAPIPDALSIVSSKKATRTPVLPAASQTPEPGKVEGREVPESEESEENNERVAQAIATRFDVPLAKIQEMHANGVGYGEIVKVYALAESTGKTVTEIMNMRAAGQGWGEIEKALGVAPGKTEPNLGEIMRNAKPKEQTDGQLAPPAAGVETEKGKGNGNSVDKEKENETGGGNRPDRVGPGNSNGKGKNK